jgi:hypothetical protein
MQAKTRRILNNQAIGITPLLFSMTSDMYISYKLSFAIGLALCIVSLAAFGSLWKRGIYQLLFVPSLLTYLCYSGFLFGHFDAVLAVYSPVFAGILLVTLLAVLGICKRSILVRVKPELLAHPSLRAALHEAFFVGQIVQNAFTLYLFIVLLHAHLPEGRDNVGFERFLYHYLNLFIGLGIIVCEQIRLWLMEKKAGADLWLPVLNAQGRVVGSMPYPGSMRLHKKYYHPLVRMAVVYKNMLYLLPRPKEEVVSPECLDHPFYHYVLYRHTVENTVQGLIAPLKDAALKPCLMLHYTFENDKVKQLISLYAITLHAESQLQHFAGGKWWTAKQIESEAEQGLFSAYFLKEFLYLQNTILLAESVPFISRV